MLGNVSFHSKQMAACMAVKLAYLLGVGLQNQEKSINFAAMKALTAIMATVAVSVGGAGLFALTSESENGQKLRSLVGLTECEEGARECLPLTDECGLNAPCSEAASKPECGAKPACTDQKKIEDQNPT